MPTRILSPDDILDAFEGSIEPVKRPFTYHLAELLVAVVMIILPIFYLALIGLVGWCVWYHTMTNTWILEEGRGRGKVMAVVVYLAPIVIGGILVAFMFKPLLSRPKQEQRDWSLDPDKEPLLFAFVHRICEIVRAPKPKRIDLDTKVNASASFRRGFVSMLGNDLVLTIGLPLVAGLNMRQLAGVLAHEFGHFSQGAGMRLTYIIRSISHWFARVVYERDAWDDWLDATAKSTDIRIGWVLHLARLFVWLTRKILWCLMMIGHGVAGHMLRQMEFDADRYEARLAGSSTFESTMREVTRLSYAQQAAMSDLGQFYSEGRLSEDFADLVVTRGDQFKPQQLAKINEGIENGTTSWLDTHPADKDRIENAHKESSRGVFQLEIPAASLFRDFAETSRSYTNRYYEEIFGEKFSRESVCSNEELYAWKKNLEGQFDAHNRVFQGTLQPFKSLKIPRFGAAADVDVERAKKEIEKARAETLQLLANYKKVSQEYEEAFEHRIQIDQAETLLAGKLKFRPDEFYVPLTDPEKIEAEKETVAKRLAVAAEKMGAFETAVGRRLAIGLGLAKAERVELDDSTKRLVAQEDELRMTQKLLDQHMPLIDTVRHTTVRMGMVFSLLQANEGDEDVINLLRQQLPIANEANRQAFDTFDRVVYPFDHADKNVSIARYCTDGWDAEHPGEVYEAGENLYTQVPRIRARIIGTFCQIIEAVEEQLGLDAFPDPPEEEEDGDDEE